MQLAAEPSAHVLKDPRSHRLQRCNDHFHRDPSVVPPAKVDDDAFAAGSSDA